jgi:hypothetical protein
MSDPTMTYDEAKAALTAVPGAREAIAAELVVLQERVQQCHELLGRKPRVAKALRKVRAPRPALGPALKADGTPRKPRGPNKKAFPPYVPKTPLATGIEKSKQA